MNKLIILALLIFAGGLIMADNPQVILKTNYGDITLELYPDKAPITVANFLQYVNDGFYEGVVFHRVIAGFMIQTGGFTADGAHKEPGKPIKNEADNGLSNELGTIAMARTNVVDSATSQFFINAKDNTFLDHTPGNFGYCVFGKVISGLDVLKKIETTPTANKKGMGDWPLENVIIQKAEVVKK
ncbi:MAG: peptidyl-prolyl cis-trans isomerase [Candidatus Cloacimonetes bacterium]|nr:peptidyl-prolyl cis-trans isomerase [Candidatus Cloacimonadota bacterium]